MRQRSAAITVADLRITAGRLGVAHLDDGLSIRRDLDHARHDAVRSLLDRRDRHHRRPLQAIAVTVALRRDLPVAAPEQILCGAIITMSYSPAITTLATVTSAGVFGRASAISAGSAPSSSLPAEGSDAAQGSMSPGCSDAPVQAAEFAAQLRAARSQHQGNVDAAGDRRGQLRRATRVHRLEAENVAGAGLRPPPWQHRASADVGADIGTGEREGRRRCRSAV